jgi:uncharacterized protein with HEPN domain
MSEQREYIDFINDIRGAADKALEFVSGFDFEQFQRDDKSIYAVVRALEILGEATKRIPPEVRVKYPGVPWRSMAGIRDKLIHDYISVNAEIVWKTTTEDLPALIPLIDEILRDFLADDVTDDS